MRGCVERYDSQTQLGMIRDECGEWYYFAVEQWNDPSNLPIDGLVVDFVIDGADVTSVWEVKNSSVHDKNR